MSRGPEQILVQNSYTINGWATLIGVDPRTVKRKVNDSEIQPVKGTEYDSRDLYAAMTAKGDIEESKARKLKAEAELAEMERDKMKGSLYDADQIREAHVKAVAIIAKRIEVLPQVWATRCNPTRPEIAHKALNDARRHILSPLEENQA